MATPAAAPIENAIDVLKPYLVAAHREFIATSDPQARLDMRAYAHAIGRLRNQLTAEDADDLRYLEEETYLEFQDDIALINADIAKAQEAGEDDKALIAEVAARNERADIAVLRFAGAKIEIPAELAAA